MSDLPVPIEPLPLTLIQQALESKIPPSELKELFDLQVRYEQRRAEEAYAGAITAFQAECPPIRKNATNTHSGKTYADFEGIMRSILPLLRKHKIVISWDTQEAPNKLLVICRVRVGTVEKITTVALPVAAASKMMNEAQAGGSAITYGRRYAITAALNLYSTDDDDDAASLYEPLSAADLAMIRELMAESGANVGRFLDWASEAAGFPVKDVADMPRTLARNAIYMLRQKIEKARKEAGNASV